MDSRTRINLVNYLSDAKQAGTAPVAPATLTAAFPDLPPLVATRAEQVLREASVAAAQEAKREQAAEALTEKPPHRQVECVMDDVAAREGHLIAAAAANVAAARRGESGSGSGNGSGVVERKRKREGANALISSFFT